MSEELSWKKYLTSIKEISCIHFSKKIISSPICGMLMMDMAGRGDMAILA